MKLLFMLPEYGFDVRGGIATYYRHLVPALRRAGCTVEVCIAQPKPSGASSNQDGVKIRWIDPARVVQAAARYPHLVAVPGLRAAVATAFAAWEACDGGRGYDVVEATDWGLLYVPWLLQESGPPMVVQLHGSGGQINFHDPFEGAELTGMTTRLLETALLGRADELQSGGPANAEEWSRLLARPVQHIWPAWNAAADVSAPLSAQAPTDTFGLVVARIQSWKGPDVLCQAVARLGRAAPEIKWIGRDHPFRRLEHSLSDHLEETYPDVWGKTVVPVGEMSREQTAALQQAASFVVISSTWDTFNLAAAEAMGAGKVVICSEGAGAARLIEHGHNGFRFPAGDFARLADLLATVSGLSTGERTVLGQHARETVVRELDVDAIADQRVRRFTHLQTAPRVARGRHPWLDSFFAASVAAPPFGFLNDVPLKDIIRHAVKRGGDRLRAIPK